MRTSPKKDVNPKGKAVKTDQGFDFVRKMYDIEKKGKGEPPNTHYQIRQNERKSALKKIKMLDG